MMDLDAIPPLRHRFLAELVDAPELERYLAAPDLDLAVTDQVESVTVRLRAGIDLLDRRILAAYLAAVRRQAWLALGYGVAFGAAIGAWLALDDDRRLVATLISAICVATGIALLLRHITIRRDMATLRALREARLTPLAADEGNDAAAPSTAREECARRLAAASRLHATVRRVVGTASSASAK